MKVLCICLFIVVSRITSAQINLNFLCYYNHQKVELQEEEFKALSSDSLEIETIKFYISNIELLSTSKSVFTEKNSFHLIDFNSNKIGLVTLKADSTLNFDRIKFNLGIDSITNVSGALGGELDPTKGMYWTWQSGYINVKVEGKSRQCGTRGNEFQFHLGGYQSPNNCLQVVVLQCSKKSNQNIVLDIRKYLEAIDLNKLNHVMLPNKTAVSLSQLFSKSFSIQ